MAGSIYAEALDQTWHHLSKQETAEHLRSDPDAGLTAEEVSQRQEEIWPQTSSPPTPAPAPGCGFCSSSTSPCSTFC